MDRYVKIIGTVIAIELALLLWGGMPFRPIEAAHAALDGSDFEMLQRELGGIEGALRNIASAITVIDCN